MPEPETMNTTAEKPDYQIAAEELRTFYAGLGLHHEIDSHGPAYADGWNHYAFTVHYQNAGAAIVADGYTTPEGSIDWRQGTGITDDPEPAEVLASAARDYADARGLTFEDWAGNLGYDTDSRKAEKIYDACLEMGEKLAALGLSDEQFNTLAEFANRL